MQFNLSGKLIEKFNTVQITDSFKKREFVVETAETNAGREFIEQIKFQLTQDKCDLVDNYNLNDTLKISFSIRGRRWEKDGKVNYFNNLEAWRIEPGDKVHEDAPPPEEFNEPFEDGDDVPF